MLSFNTLADLIIKVRIDTSELKNLKAQVLAVDNSVSDIKTTAIAALGSAAAKSKDSVNALGVALGSAAGAAAVGAAAGSSFAIPKIAEQISLMEDLSKRIEESAAKMGNRPPPLPNPNRPRAMGTGGIGGPPALPPSQTVAQLLSQGNPAVPTTSITLPGRPPKLPSLGNMGKMRTSLGGTALSALGLGRFAGLFAVLSTSTLGWGAAIAVLVGSLMKALKSFVAARKELVAFKAAAEASLDFEGKQSQLESFTKSFQDFARNLSKTSRLTTEEILKVASIGLDMKVPTKELENFTQLAVGLKNKIGGSTENAMKILTEESKGIKTDTHALRGYHGQNQRMEKLAELGNAGLEDEKKQVNSLGGAWDQLMANVGEALKYLGQILAPFAQAILEIANDWVKWLADIYKGLADIVGEGTGIKDIFKAVLKVISMLAGAVFLVMNPLTAMVIFGKELLTIFAPFGKLLGKIVAWFGQGAKWMTELVSKVQNGLVAQFQRVADIIDSIDWTQWEMFFMIIGSIFGDIGQAIENFAFDLINIDLTLGRIVDKLLKMSAIGSALGKLTGFSDNIAKDVAERSKIWNKENMPQTHPLVRLGQAKPQFQELGQAWRDLNTMDVSDAKQQTELQKNQLNEQKQMNQHLSNISTSVKGLKVGLA
ncbi:MAG: hypothetical protein KGZ39_05665 [Simkania sp.]|nr:hypothetical protein [Simkania sp.]